MPAVRVSPGRLGPRVRDLAVNSLHRRKDALGQVLVSQAQNRIMSGRDSEVTYPDLWATKTGLGYRAGGQPLRDTGQLFNALTAEALETPSGLNISLIDGTPTGYAIKHQTGFVNEPPNFVPLTRKAARMRAQFDGIGGVKEMRAAAINAGLVEGRSGDFIVLTKPATVPPRPIYNMPPENRRELGAMVRRALGG